MIFKLSFVEPGDAHRPTARNSADFSRDRKSELDVFLIVVAVDELRLVQILV